MRIDATPDLHRIYKGIITFSPYTYSIDDTNEEQNYSVLNLLHVARYQIGDQSASCEAWHQEEYFLPICTVGNPHDYQPTRIRNKRQETMSSNEWSLNNLVRMHRNLSFFSVHSLCTYLLQQLFLEAINEGHQTQERSQQKPSNECLLTLIIVVSRFSSMQGYSSKWWSNLFTSVELFPIYLFIDSSMK